MTTEKEEIRIKLEVYQELYEEFRKTLEGDEYTNELTGKGALLLAFRCIERCMNQTREDFGKLPFDSDMRVSDAFPNVQIYQPKQE